MIQSPTLNMVSEKSSGSAEAEKSHMPGSITAISSTPLVLWLLILLFLFSLFVRGAGGGNSKRWERVNE